MLDLQTRIATLKRPGLLVRAVRFGIDDYRRSVHLGRLLGLETLPKHAQAIVQLLDIEAELDGLRVAHSGRYSPARHVEILIAIAGEARLLRATALRLA